MTYCDLIFDYLKFWEFWRKEYQYFVAETSQSMIELYYLLESVWLESIYK